MSFYRKHHPILRDYSICNSTLERVQEIRDLGVIFDRKLAFTKHVDFIIGKSFATLGFTKRICSNLNSNLEFCSIVWHPSYAVHSARIESIQKQFVLYALRGNGWDRQNLPSYKYRCSLLDIESLERRRFNSSVFFMFDVLSGKIDSPEILSLIPFRIPSRALREHALFATTPHRTNYGKNGPCDRLIANFNRVAEVFDFGKPRQQFRTEIKSLDDDVMRQPHIQ